MIPPLPIYIEYFLFTFCIVQSEYTGDSQLVNSVYLDNSSLEIYHGRLDERPNALAVRITWQGPQEPTEVQVERKSQKPIAAKGYEDFAERLDLPVDAVLGYLEGELDIHDAEDYWRRLVSKYIYLLKKSFLI